MFRCCSGSLLWRQCGWCERNRNRKWGLSTYIRIYKLGNVPSLWLEYFYRWKHDNCQCHCFSLREDNWHLSSIWTCNALELGFTRSIFVLSASIFVLRMRTRKKVLRVLLLLHSCFPPMSIFSGSCGLVARGNIPLHNRGLQLFRLFLT